MIGRVSMKATTCSLSRASGGGLGRGSSCATQPQCARMASISSATMLVILIAGFTAGPAVSL